MDNLVGTESLRRNPTLTTILGQSPAELLMIAPHLASIPHPYLSSSSRSLSSNICFVTLRSISMASTTKKPKRFAPLNPQASSNDSPPLKGIVFDVDGTLCKPQSYMFTQMRAALDIPKSTDILDHMHALPEPAQSEAQTAIRAIESAAMVRQEAQPGLVELIEYLERRHVRMGLCTRNFDGPVMHLLQNFLPGKTFAPIVTRDFRPPKPSPDGILHIASAWGLDDGGKGLIMVGDSIDDMAAGHAAGSATVLLAREGNEDLREHEQTGFVIERLDDLIGILDGGFEERSPSTIDS